MDIAKLNPDQQRAFNRLKKAYEDCKKLGVFFANSYGELIATDSALVSCFGDESMRPNRDSVFVSIENAGSNNSIQIPGEWSDDFNGFWLTDEASISYQEAEADIFNY